MRPVSAALLRSLHGSHGMRARARVVTSWQTGTDPDGVEIPIIAGDVVMDWTAKIRSSVDMTTKSALWPVVVDDPLTPYGNELFVERGVRLSNGVTEWVSLGYFRIDETEQDNVPFGAVRIAGQDRMAGIVDGDLVAPMQWNATDTYGQVVSDLVLDVYPDATIEWDDDAYLQPIDRAVICEQDRYGFIDELITGLGKIWHWDHRGILVIRDVPDPAEPVWEVAGGEGGVLVDINRKLTRVGVYNGVVASGEAADTETPPRAVAIDAGLDSPTRWGGRFGKVPDFFSSPLLTDPDQCAKAARTRLMQVLGVPYMVDFTAVPNPALEPLDPVRIRQPRGRDGVHVLARLTMPLTAKQAMTSTTREQPVILTAAGRSRIDRL